MAICVLPVVIVFASILARTHPFTFVSENHEAEVLDQAIGEDLLTAAPPAAANQPEREARAPSAREGRRATAEARLSGLSPSSMPSAATASDHGPQTPTPSPSPASTAFPGTAPWKSSPPPTATPAEPEFKGSGTAVVDLSIDRDPGHWQFIQKAIAPAQQSQHETGVPASVTIAQAIHESAWGTSGLSRTAQNFFGIKARGKSGPAGVVNMKTGEHINGADVTVVDAFRAYHNMEESIRDHGHFFLENPRYALALARANDPRAFIRLVASAGYATDPAYAAKVLAYMDRYDLYRFDLSGL